MSAYNRVAQNRTARLHTSCGFIVYPENSAKINFPFPVTNGHDVYPSYSFFPSFPSITANKLAPVTPLCAAAAAAVLDVGKELESPNEKMLGY